jgi:hypothetical protein
MVAGRAWEVGIFDAIGWPRALVIATVASCWDADRLDIPRVGVAPIGEFMSTPVWREVRPLSARIHASGVTSAGAGLDGLRSVRRRPARGVRLARAHGIGRGCGRRMAARPVRTPHGACVLER